MSSREEWDRQKRYLIRSLFDDVPLLSPISERPEISTDTISPRRPYSPLPDLIIERERYKHDDPEEYYQDLEKKVIKLYRKLFSKTRSVSNDFSGGLSSDIVTTVLTDRCDEISVGTKGIQSDDDSIGSGKTPEQNKTNTESPSTSPFQAVTLTQADVHRAESVERTDINQAEYILQSEHELPVDKPEIMRRQGTIESVNSIHVLNDDIYFAADVTHNTISREMDEGEKTLNLSGILDTSITDIMIPDHNQQNEYVIYRILSEKSSDESSFSPKRRRLDNLALQTGFTSKEGDNCQDFVTSTPNTGKQDQVRTQQGTVRNVLPEKSPEQTRVSAKCPNFKNLTTQTSFSSDDFNWQDIKKCFFVGTPLIYKLCSCRNHVCA